MPTTRVIYQSEALFNTTDIADVTSTVNQTGFYVQQFSRVQSCNYNFAATRKDVNQYGNLAAIDRVILDQPTVGLDFSYLLSDGGNEKAVGFSINSQTTLAGVTVANATTPALSGILTSGFVNNKNYFIRTVPQGNDANGFTNDTAGNVLGSTIGIGNGFLTNYSVDAAVGDFPKASVTIEALNMNFSAGNSGINPAVTTSGTNVGGFFQLPTGATNPNPENPGAGVSNTISALRHGDIQFSLTKTAGVDYAGSQVTGSNFSAIQSFNIGLNLKRTNLLKIGSRYAYSKEIDFPVSLELNVKALVQDLTTGNLSDLVAADHTYDALIKLAAPGTTGIEGMGYALKRIQLDSQDFSSAIGNNKEVSLKFSTQIGSPQQTDRGLFIFETLPI